MQSLSQAFHQTPNSLCTPMDSSSSNAIVTEIKYKGVRKRKWGKYVSEIRLPNSRERIWLGSYETAEKAARAFDAALFCLRGHRAKFNFPDDPPEIVGGQSLAPAEIQVVAQQYGNSYGGSSSYQPPPPAAAQLSDCDGEMPVDLVDWSFWDTVDSNGGGINDGDGDGDVSGYGLFPEPGDMHMGPYFEEMSHQDDEYGYFSHENHVPSSFLWNF